MKVLKQTFSHMILFLIVVFWIVHKNNLREKWNDIARVLQNTLELNWVGSFLYN